MKKYLAFFVLTCLSIPVMLGAFVWTMRAAPFTPAQELALRRLRAPTPPVRGKDASDAIWLLGLEVPPSRRHAVAAQIRAFEAQRGQPGASTQEPRDDWPAYARPPKEDLCADRDRDCLQFVSRHRAQVAAVLAASAGALRAQTELADYDGYRRGVPISDELVFPRPGSYRTLVRSSLALRFLDGERAAAIAGACHDVAGGRRVGGDSDDLINSMMGVAQVREDLKLIAQMLALQPVATPLPPECERALAASQDYEYGLCPAIRSEFPYFVRLAYDDATPLTRFMVDWPRFQARVAEHMGRYCDPGLSSGQRADTEAGHLLKAVPPCSARQERADPLGCLLAPIYGSGYRRYLDRRTDQAQMLALMRVVLWLRTRVDAGVAIPAALAHIPPELGLLRVPSYDAQRRLLSIPLHDTSHESTYALAVAVRAQ